MMKHVPIFYGQERRFPLAQLQPEAFLILREDLKGQVIKIFGFVISVIA